MIVVFPLLSTGQQSVMLPFLYLFSSIQPVSQQSFIERKKERLHLSLRVGHHHLHFCFQVATCVVHLLVNITTQLTMKGQQIALLALISLLMMGVIYAHADPSVDGDDNDSDDGMRYNDGVLEAPRSVCRVMFPNASTTTHTSFPAGSKATAVIAYKNNIFSHAHTVILIVAYLQPKNKFNTVLQNFSVVRQARVVQPQETVTFLYTFTPDVHFELGDYNLVVGLHYQDDATNLTYFYPAFNGTVTIKESLNTDPRTVLTYMTLLSICFFASYIAASKFGILKMIEKALTSRKKKARPHTQVEVGTSGQGYDPDYVNHEHYRFRDELLRKSSASPKKRK